MSHPVACGLPPIISLLEWLVVVAPSNLNKENKPIQNTAHATMWISIGGLESVFTDKEKILINSKYVVDLKGKS